MDDLLLMDI